MTGSIPLACFPVFLHVASCVRVHYFYCQIILHCVKIPYFVYPFISWWTFWLFPRLFIMNNTAMKIIVQVFVFYHGTLTVSNCIKVQTLQLAFQSTNHYINNSHIIISDQSYHFFQSLLVIGSLSMFLVDT